MFKYIWQGLGGKQVMLELKISSKVNLPGTAAAEGRNWVNGTGFALYGGTGINSSEAWSLLSSWLQKLPETGQHVFQPIVTGVTAWAQPVYICH